MPTAAHLTFHYIREPGGLAASPGITPEALEQKLRTYLDAGYEFLPLGEYAHRFATQQPLPEKVATLSFDDGLKDHITQALPIIERVGVPATFFVIAQTMSGNFPWVIANQYLKARFGGARMRTEVLPKVLAEYPQYLELLKSAHESIGELCAAQEPEMRVVQAVTTRYVPSALLGELLDEFMREEFGDAFKVRLFLDRFMSSEDVATAARAGISIGSHTWSHPYLTTISGQDAKKEFVHSKRELEGVVGANVTLLAYPFGGDMPARVVAAASWSGYTSAWNFLLPGMSPDSSSPYDIRRIDGVRAEPR